MAFFEPEGVKAQNISVREGEFVCGFVFDGTLYAQSVSLDVVRQDKLHEMHRGAVLSLIYAEGKKEGKWKDHKDFVRIQQEAMVRRKDEVLRGEGVK